MTLCPLLSTFSCSKNEGAGPGRALVVTPIQLKGGRLPNKSLGLTRIQYKRFMFSITILSCFLFQKLIFFQTQFFHLEYIRLILHPIKGGWLFYKSLRLTCIQCDSNASHTSISKPELQNYFVKPESPQNCLPMTENHLHISVLFNFLNSRG